MKHLTYIIVIIILFIIAYIGWNKPPIIKEKTDIKIDTVYKRVVDTTYVVKNKIVYEKVYIPKDVDIDTQAVIAAYYTKRVNLDTVKRHGVSFIIRDSLYKNGITNREIINFTFPIITKTKTIRRNRYYVGLTPGGNMDMFSLSIGGALVTKKGRLFIAGYDVVNRAFNFGVYFQLKFRNRDGH
jgi:hypothetical protein